MIPVPQYPLYSATITLFDGTAVSYYLDEDKGWDLNAKELLASLEKARAKGTDVKAIAIINPGNPTGQCLSKESIVEIIKLAKRERLVILADEVYQTNAYLASRPFHSFKKVLFGMDAEFHDQELISFHSISKGMIGECGRRGGYMECVNIDKEVKEQLLKRASISLCSNVSGQILTGLMCRPPKAGEPSFALYDEELRNVYESLKRRATRLADAFNKMQGVRCNDPMGAMYLFPQITLSKAAQEAAHAAALAPDAFYCLRLLEATGVVCVCVCLCVSLCVVCSVVCGASYLTNDFALPPTSALCRARALARGTGPSTSAARSCRRRSSLASLSTSSR
jgi:aspartate/methionine/tyrosine aminotransferase